MNLFLTPLALMVADVLGRHRNAYKWETQGFGMLRTYLDDNQEWRLHVWDKRLRVPNVSLIHDHPWDFTSFVVCGQMHNRVYVENSRGQGVPINRARIKPGASARILDDVTQVRLKPVACDTYKAGETYSQQCHVIHETDFTDSTITLVRRTRPKNKPDEANVYFPDDWVDARPIPVYLAGTSGEVIEKALDNLNAMLWRPQQ